MIKTYLKKFWTWLWIYLYGIFINIGIAMNRTNDDIFSSVFVTTEKDKKIQRKRHRNQVLEKFYAGQRDEKYVQDYYELLKKADKFMRNATPSEMEMAAWKHGTSYGMEHIPDGNKEHYGFFDDKHKNKGMSLAEVMEKEYQERRTKDDEFELVNIFNNKPIEVGLAKAFDVINNIEDDVKVVDISKQSSRFEFPIKIDRAESVINKIEQLSEFMHVKKIAFDEHILEFFIPLKYKTNTLLDDDEIISELIKIDNVFINDEYGELIGFRIKEFRKRITHNDTHEVFKFNCVKMETINKK